MTLNESVESVFSTRMATLYKSSRSRRSRIFRLVTLFPSMPAKGPLLTEKIIPTVGSSTAIRFSGRESKTSVIESPIVKSSIPATMAMSPAPISGT
jgi:hypothetical protein